jgi:hypothetical protein
MLLVNVQRNKIHIQHRPLLSLTQNLENRKMKTSIISRDLKTRLRYIMCWEWSQLVFRSRPSFLLLVMIIKIQTLFDSGASVCFIDKELV